MMSDNEDSYDQLDDNDDFVDFDEEEEGTNPSPKSLIKKISESHKN